jgi:hypothetical protein
MNICARRGSYPIGAQRRSSLKARRCSEKPARAKMTKLHLRVKGFLKCKRPNIPPEVLSDLEKFGIEPIKIKLLQDSNEPDAVVRFDNASARRREIRDWLKWKAEKEVCWVVSVIAMFAALAAAVFGYLSLLK